MTSLDLLKQWIKSETDALATNVPGDTETAVHALLRARQSTDVTEVMSRTVVVGTGLAHPGLGLALQFVLESGSSGYDGDEDLDEWAPDYLRFCDALADATMIARHVATGFMQLDGPDEARGVRGWITSDRQPAQWRELATWSRWGAWANAMASIERPTDSAHLMSYQFGYPAESTVFGAKGRDWTQLIGALFEMVESGEADSVSSQYDKLIVYLSARLKAKPEQIAARLPLLVLDRENAAAHATPPAIAAAPIIRVGENRVVISPHGVWLAPLMFITREMRRQDAALYHNAAQAKEDMFRRELYELFPESRFVMARNRILLRRPEGEARTDIDAAIFDKKTGTLAIFELKALDPFARTTDELNRQRDNMLEAGHQIEVILDWIKNHGADEVLKRFDPGAARKFKVARVLPFVLGRSLAVYDDGPKPSASAVWSDWPTFNETSVRILDTDAGNPLASLHTRLSQLEIPQIELPLNVTGHQVLLEQTNRIIHIFRSRDEYDLETSNREGEKA